PRKTRAIDRIGLTLFENKQLEEAAAVQTEVLNITQRIYGEEHPETIMANSRLATTLFYQGL
ncbi:hypothetical protein LZ30DRAFT_607531, partial [Colletotrichum cereale]